MKNKLDFRLDEYGCCHDSKKIIDFTTKDTVVLSVMEDLNQRSLVGIGKYGTTLDREDLSMLDFLQHAYEECLDQANYLKKLIIMSKEKK